jgi:flagellar hook-associated protein 1 FlgK
LFSKTDIRVMGRPIGSFDDYGTVIRFDVGNTLHTAKQATETSRILMLAANNQRTSIAGVSLDEEMVGLVRYNHAYNGAARIITAMDDALDRLINGTGRVGL